ncbi:Agouti-related protein 2 [Scophthalmus maximus]|uniref:Agouti-related protein 2 n=1 Tax=Scophthalmus maximus TaxID=52904 RepID=A0A2U9BLS1_SCOMX|nr:agouti-signaling protein 2b [Scophthalmus maximus]XP_047188038.1 agouti-signaling protein 2b [Scophthalmus maximus]AWP04382.1 Agouti-related protein 2 [Scophthalmus maximus]
MRQITGKHLLCFFLLVFPLSWAEDTKRDGRRTQNDSDLIQIKSRRLFARQKVSPSKENPTAKRKSNLNPARRCGRLMENCSSRVPCCDPCASCRCRLFNTICHCWRINHLCQKRT